MVKPVPELHTLVTDPVTDLVTGHTWQEALSQWERASDLLTLW